MKLETFDFESQAVRVINRNGAPWFVAVDVCRVLDLTNVTEATRSLDADELDSEILNSGAQGRKTVVISESGLYALIFKSRKTQARKFRKWVTAEVLPAIRASGRFEVPMGTGAALTPIEVVSVIGFVRENCVGWALERQMDFGLMVRRYSKAMGVIFQPVMEPGIGRVFGFSRGLMEGLMGGFARAVVPAECQEMCALLAALHEEHGDARLSAEVVRCKARAMGLFPDVWKLHSGPAQQGAFGGVVRRHAGQRLPGGWVIETNRNGARRSYEVRHEGKLSTEN